MSKCEKQEPGIEKLLNLSLFKHLTRDILSKVEKIVKRGEIEKAADIGDIHDWRSGKHRKTDSGWERVKEGESGGVSVGVEKPQKKSLGVSDLQDMPVEQQFDSLSVGMTSEVSEAIDNTTGVYGGLSDGRVVATGDEIAEAKKKYPVASDKVRSDSNVGLVDGWSSVGTDAEGRALAVLSKLDRIVDPEEALGMAEYFEADGGHIDGVNDLVRLAENRAGLLHAMKKEGLDMLSPIEFQDLVNAPGWFKENKSLQGLDSRSTKMANRKSNKQEPGIEKALNLGLFQHLTRDVGGNIEKQFGQPPFAPKKPPAPSKGRGAPIGEVHDWKRGKYVKTKTGWERVQGEHPDSKGVNEMSPADVRSLADSYSEEARKFNTIVQDMLSHATDVEMSDVKAAREEEEYATEEGSGKKEEGSDESQIREAQTSSFEEVLGKLQERERVSVEEGKKNGNRNAVLTSQYNDLLSDSTRKANLASLSPISQVMSAWGYRPQGYKKLGLIEDFANDLAPAVDGRVVATKKEIERGLNRYGIDYSSTDKRAVDNALRVDPSVPDSDFNRVLFESQIKIANSAKSARAAFARANAMEEQNIHEIAHLFRNRGALLDADDENIGPSPYGHQIPDRYLPEGITSSMRTEQGDAMLRAGSVFENVLSRHKSNLYPLAEKMKPAGQHTQNRVIALRGDINRAGRDFDHFKIRDTDRKRVSGEFDKISESMGKGAPQDVAEQHSLARAVRAANRIASPKIAWARALAFEDENLHGWAAVLYNRSALLHAENRRAKMEDGIDSRSKRSV